MFAFKEKKLKRLLKRATALHNYRQSNKVTDNAIKKESDLYLSMAKIYDKLTTRKKYPHAWHSALINYRSAAMLGDSTAQYIVGERLTEEAKFWDKQKEGVYASTVYSKYATMYFEEAYAFFDAAAKSNFSKAKRMKGLLLINGWGVAQDTDEGLKLVIESIEQDGSWDKAAQIFGELGLNKPEFFNAIMTHKQSRS